MFNNSKLLKQLPNFIPIGEMMSSLSAFIFQALDTRFFPSPFIDFQYFRQVKPEDWEETIIH